MLAPVTEILEAAQKEALPEDRRRPIKSMALLHWEAQQEIKTLLKQFCDRHFDKTIVAPESMPFKPPTVEAESAPPAPKVEPPPPVVPREPFIIEFRTPKAEKTDLVKLLADVPTPVLYGFALERLMKNGLSQLPSLRPAPDVVRVEATVPAPEPPVVIKADSVVDPTPPEDGRKRVLVLGLLPTAQGIVQEKAKNFLRLDPTFCDTNTKTMPAVTVDYAIIMDGLITRFQIEQIQKRFATKDRVIHCNTVDEVMRKLADLNSVP